MNTSDSLLAEQSIYAHLIVKKEKTELSKFQKATESETSIYKYEPNTSTKLTNVDTSQYSIINLPDTISRVPNDSIFSLIKLIRKNSPDFRFVNIAPLVNANASNKRIAITTDDDSKIKRFKGDKNKKRRIFSTKYAQKPTLNDDDINNYSRDSTSSSSEDENEDGKKKDNDLSEQRIRTDYDKDDSAFDKFDFKNVTNLPDFEINLIVPIVAITRTFTDSKTRKSKLWYEALFNAYNINSVDALNEITFNNNYKNEFTLKANILEFLMINVEPTNPENYMDSDIENIKNLIDTYVRNITQ